MLKHFPLQAAALKVEDEAQQMVVVLTVLELVVVTTVCRQENNISNRPNKYNHNDNTNNIF